MSQDPVWLERIAKIKRLMNNESLTLVVIKRLTGFRLDREVGR